MNLYTDFNNVEGAIWIVAALALPFLAKLSTTGKKLAVATSSLGFLAFGATDFLEASLTGVVPWWLWALKIVSGATILCGRFAYMGWKQFKFTDRYFWIVLSDFSISHHGYPIVFSMRRVAIEEVKISIRIT